MIDPRALLHHEYSLFRRLSRPARALYLTIIAVGIALPLINTFASAYIWRFSHSLTAVAWYNLVFYVGVSAGFLANGVLLRFVDQTKLFAAEMPFQGAAMGILYMCPQETPGLVLLAGGCIGGAVGLFWGSRNLLMLDVLRGADREYFSAIEVFTNTALSVAVPLLFGWAIALAAGRAPGAAAGQYRLLLMVSTVVLVLGAVQVWRARFPPASMNGKLFSPAFPGRWCIGAFGFLNGIGSIIVNILPPLCTLRLLGMEGVLGTIQSGAALFSVLVVYLVGSRASTTSSVALFRVSIGFLCLGATALALDFGIFGAAAFVLCCTISTAFFWSTVIPMVFGALERVGPKDGYYALVCEREMALSAGRAGALGFFLLLAEYTSADAALRFGPLLLALVQLGSLPLAARVQAIRLAEPAFAAQD